MPDEKNRGYVLEDFDSEVKKTSKPEKKELDYGDDFDAQTGENNEVHNPDEYYVHKSVRRNKKKENKRKVKNAVIIACIAIVCILVVFAFALTQCSMPKIELSMTTAPTLPTIVRETKDTPEQVTDKPTQQTAEEEETTVESNETTIEETTQAETQEATEPVTVVTEEVTQVIETEPVTEEVTELPDPEIEDFGQDQDY